MNQSASLNDTVTIHFTACTRDGGVIEDTTNRKPVVLKLNDSNYTEALRKNIVGMFPGERKTIIANPEQVFGYRDHNRQITVPLSGLPSGIRKGDQLSASIQDSEVDVWVVQISEHEAVLDTNHPLAGETIEYKVQLVTIDT